MRIVSVIVLILTITGIQSCRYFREKGLFLDRELKKSQVSAVKDSILIADSVQKAIIMTEVTEVTRTDSSVKNGEADPKGSDRVNSFYIIIGTYTNPENARSAARQYTEKGYSTDIINSRTSKGNKAELVSVKSFDNHDDAVGFLREFQRKVESKAWIYPRQ